MDDVAADIDIDLSPESLAGANVNPNTGLATDYLNVFNEALMLIALAGDAPDVLEDLAEWRPVTYVEHFRASGFHFREVAIASYELANTELRTAFDAAARELAGAIEAAIVSLSTANDAGESLSEMASNFAVELQSGVAHLDAMIHGVSDETSAQDAIDALFD